MELIYPALVLFCGYLVLGITGMGSALVVVPLLALRWPLPEVVALAILLDIPASMLHGGLNLRNVHWHEMVRLLPGMACGTVSGIWLMDRLDRKWPLFVLGIYIVIVAIRAWRASAEARPPQRQRVNAWAWLIGVVEVMFATAGPVVVAWLQVRKLDVQGLRATVPVIMVLAGAVAVGVLFGLGRTEWSVVAPRWLFALPFAFAGVVLGNLLASRIPPVQMKRTLSVLLVVSGLALMRHVLP